MARVWHHISPTTGQWVEWEAGTLPSAESCFRFEFLNQFIGWMRYVGNFAYDGDYHVPAYLAPTTMPYFSSKVAGRSAEKFLLPGDDLQDLALWNSIGQFDPTSGMTLTDNAWKHFTDAFIDTLGTEEVEEALAENEEYLAAAPLDPLTGGDVVQFSRASDCPIRTALLNARTRLDLCRFAKVPHWSAMDYFILHDYQGSGGSTTFDDYRTVREDDSVFPNNSYKNTVLVIKFANWAGDPPIGTIQEMSLRKIAARLSSSAAATASHDLVVASKGVTLPNYTTYPSPEVYTENHVSRFFISDLTEEAAEVDTVFGPLSSPGYITSGPFYADVANTNNFYAVPLDALPTDFKPAAGFPWE